MSNVIVMNTLNGAVTEYTLPFQSMTPTHGGNASGLYALGGDLDDTQPIVAVAKTGVTTWGSTVRKTLDAIYVAIRGSGTSETIVITPSTEWPYPLVVKDTGVSRSIPGGGIRENYLGFGYTNSDGADFIIDSIEVDINMSDTRRVD